MFKLNCTNPEYYNLAPVPLSLHYAIEHFSSKGIDQIDMNVGRKVHYHKKDSKAYKIDKFKSRWGEEITYYVYLPKYLIPVIDLIRKII